KIDLASRDDVIAHLRKNRMVVVQIREAKGGGVNLAAFFKAGVKTRDVVIFTRQFSTMINSGLPLVQALDILSQQTENKILADITRAVVYDVESGHTLADALRKHPKAFSDLYVNMVAAGEAGGIRGPAHPHRDRREQRPQELLVGAHRRRDLRLCVRESLLQDRPRQAADR